jgi:hypothetical protein
VLELVGFELFLFISFWLLDKLLLRNFFASFKLLFLFLHLFLLLLT